MPKTHTRIKWSSKIGPQQKEIALNLTNLNHLFLLVSASASIYLLVSFLYFLETVHSTTRFHDFVLAHTQIQYIIWKCVYVSKRERERETGNANEKSDVAIFTANLYVFLGFFHYSLILLTYCCNKQVSEMDSTNDPTNKWTNEPTNQNPNNTGEKYNRSIVLQTSITGSLTLGRCVPIQ